MCFLSGVESNDDMQHLDHEIKELNESNLKIEADMMHLQTQVNTHTHRTCQATRCFRALTSYCCYIATDLIHGVQLENYRGRE